ncbi:MAG: LysM peptidoglycan-binding domain-containing protein [Desulfobacterales bacterium]|nr:LysM peptidoglycan-binding domain-containing protein [Desulfobacterales bacterium]
MSSNKYLIFFAFFFFIGGILIGGACVKEKQGEGEKVKVVIPIKKDLLKQPEQPKEQSESQANISIKAATYKVQKGDSLFKIAGRNDVYANPFKWTSLLRHNLDTLHKIIGAEQFQHKKLPEGIELKFITSSENKEKLAISGSKPWVVNVISSQDSKEISLSAITLIQLGYHVYISRALVKEQEWMRLRVGFFKDESEAGSVGKEIKSVLNTRDAWIIKIDNDELTEFGGY